MNTAFYTVLMRLLTVHLLLNPGFCPVHLVNFSGFQESWQAVDLLGTFPGYQRENSGLPAGFPFSTNNLFAILPALVYNLPSK